MPSPILHAAVGLAAARVAQGERVSWRGLLCAAALACLADVDFIPGVLAGDPLRFHHHLTHSIAFAAGAAWLLSRWRWGGESRRARFLCLLLVALSHPLLDLFNYELPGPLYGPDPGLSLLWPLGLRLQPLAALFESAPISPDWRDWFVPGNLLVFARESLLAFAVLAAAWLAALRRRAAAPAQAPTAACRTEAG